MKLKAFLVIIPALLLAACQSCSPLNPPVVPPDSGDAGPSPTVVVPTPPIGDAGPTPDPAVDPVVRSTCTNLAKIGCVEGGPMCLRTFQNVLVDGLTKIPWTCLVSATDKSDVHACGKEVPCQ